MKMDAISGELLNRAIGSYFENAFRRHADQKRNRPSFDPALSLPQILSKKHPFEDLTGSTTNSGSSSALVPVGGLGASTLPRVYALRLGNDAYPHMKLALVEVYYHDEFVFAVDRHDTFHFEPDVPGYQAWCELKEINRLLKETIEDAWYKAGLPTLRRLREERFTRPDLVRNLRAEGNTILILDDDEARAGILRGILAEAGYDAFSGPPGPRPNPDDTAVVRAKEKAQGGSLRLPAGYCQKADDVRDLCDLITARRVAMVILDVSYRTGQGPRVAGALRLNSRSQEIPILAIYSRRDFGPDPDLFTASLRRPYRTEAILQILDQTLVRRSSGGSGLHKAVE